MTRSESSISISTSSSDLDSHALEPGDRPAQESRGADTLLVGQDLDVGETGGVVDADVDELPADRVATDPGAVGLLAVIGAAAATADPLAGASLDPPQLLDVDVDQLARALALVAGGSGGARELRLPRPIRASHLETVESAIPSTSAISAAVIRSRLSASIAS